MAFFFWGIMIMLVGGIWLISSFAFMGSRSSSSRTARWFGTVPFLSVSLVVLSTIGLAAYAFISSNNPSNIFQQEFDFRPTPDVKNLNSRYYMFGDSAESYLKFQASPSTIQRITKTGFTKMTASQTTQTNLNLPFSGNSDEPIWWKPKATP